MADESVFARGFSLSHQRVALDIDFEGRLTGTACLIIYPNNPSLRCVNLHATPPIDIRSVTLSSPTDEDAFLPTPASFSHTAPAQPLPVRDPPVELTSHPEIKRKTWAAMGEQDEGELAVLVSNGWVRLVQKGDTVEFAPIHIEIEYTLNLGGEITEGIVFRRESQNEIPHMFLSPTSHVAARIWTPCVDSLWERCTWELEFTVPHTLPDRIDLPPFTVVSSGELMEQITHPHNPNKTIFYYLQASPTTVQHILFAAGPFEMQLIHQEEKKAMIGFCLPGDQGDMENSTAFMSKAMTFYSTEFGVYPFSDYKMVFVSEPRSDHAVGATMSLFSSELLHPPDIIDQVFETRQVLGLALAQQWLGVNIIPRTLADTWVVNGLCIYIYGLFLRHLQGNNEYRFRLKREIDRCARMDQGDKAPICQPGTQEIDVEFINLKAPLVMHILDRYLTKTGTSSGLSRIIPKIFLAALSDELPGNTISTQSFFKYCRKASGLDLGAFHDQWVFGSGCPKMKVQTNFIRKKFVVELTVEQTQPATKSKLRPTQFFEGSLTIRIHEADGAPFEHLVDVKSSSKTFTLPFNTKYKRTKRSGRIAARFDHLRDQMQADETDEDALRDTDRTDVFAYPPWDNERERADWRVAEWTEDQADAMMTEGSGYEWIRIDPDCEWLALFEFPEKPWYWISQLQGDKDVIAQLEAVQNLTAYSSYPVVASELARTVLVSNYFYRIRTEAAKALVFLDTPDAQHMGSFLLLKLLDHLGPDGKNDFSDIAQYFVLKSVISAVSNLREPAKAGETVRMVPLRRARDAIIELLDHNDNTDNRYSDYSYTATLISGLGNMLGTAGDNRAATAIEKAITLDRLLPSFGNVVTKAGLEAHLKSIMIGQITNDPRLFLGYTREGNLRSLRLLAFDALLLCKPLGRSQPLAKYLLNIITKDPSLVVRRHVARAMSESILMALAFGDIINASARVIDTSIDEVVRQKETDKAIVKALRQDYEKKPEVMGWIGEILKNNYAQFDDAIRFAFIKVAEMTTQSLPEPPPGNIIKLHTPVTEVPPTLPTKIRLSLPGSTVPEGFSNFGGNQPLKLVIPGKKVVPAQRRGLPEADLKAINNALNKLTSHVCSEFFRAPVDPLRDGAPDYFTIVKEPMDLETSRAKLSSGQYTSRQEFFDDMEKIVRNCIMYNGEQNDIGRAAKRFRSVFHQLWTKTEATLVKRDQDTAPQPQAPAPTLGPAFSPAPAPAPRAPSAETPEHRSSSIKFKMPAPVVKQEPTTPVLPMAPPPVPQRKISIAVPNKKRPRDSDAILADEVDAISAPQPRKADLSPEIATAPKKARRSRSPEKQSSQQLKIKTKKKEMDLDAYLDTPDTPAPAPSPAPAVTPSPASSAVSAPQYRFANEPPASRSAGNMPFRMKRAKALVTLLQKEPSAAWFLRPVDPIADGCPTYLKEITKPRDLGTILKKVEGKEGKKYQTMQQLGEDIELVFSNCRKFNGPGAISELADTTEAVYRREWPKAIDPRMAPDEKRAMSSLITRAMKEPLGIVFREPVDPVALNIPTYFEVIPEEDARDLSLIKSNFDKGRYTTYKQVDDDFALMLENARVFNGEGEITDTANKFGRWWDAQRRKMD